MISFCDNKFCTLHQIPAAPVTEVLVNDRILKVSRHPFEVGTGTVWLCATCVNAVKMVSE